MLILAHHKYELSMQENRKLYDGESFKTSTIQGACYNNVINKL